ncbi:hypothetical protein ACQ4PT_013893 [Festuca glaucescens]
MEEKISRKKKMARTTNVQAEAAVPAAVVAVAEAAVPPAAGLLTDDIIVEILSRLPARSVHRFKCVSPSWRDLIADPAHRKKLPHALAGFLYNTYNRGNPRLHDFHFANVSAGAAPPVDPSLPFLPPDEYPSVDPCLLFLPPDEYAYVPQLDTCNGLLLCLAYMAPSSPSVDEDEQLDSHYVVCNPATERWVDLPPHPKVPLGGHITARLAFDPAASSHFHVFQFAKANEEDCITGVDIYSSRTRAWNRRESRLIEKFSLYFGLAGVLFRGMLHLLGWLHPMNHNEDAVLVAVDVEGQVWKTIRVPSGGLSFGKIGLSQGCLHYATTPFAVVDRDNNNIKKKKKKQKEEEDTSLATKIASVWCMKDYDSKEWVLKHTISDYELQSITTVNYKVAAIHPDCDTIFLDSCDVDTLASFDMQRRKFHHILQLEKNRAWQFVPYVPLFSDSFAGADGQ